MACLIQLGLGLINLILGVFPDGIPSKLRSDIGQRLQTIDILLDQSSISIAVGHQIGSSLKEQVGVGIGIHREGGGWKQDKIAGLPGTQRGRTAFHTDIERGIGAAHHGKAGVHQSIFIVPGACVQLNGVANAQPGFLQHTGFHQTLSIVLGHPSFEQRRNVELLGVGEYLDGGILI